MKCPKCQDELATIETRSFTRTACNYTRRRKQCRNCKQRISTIELVVTNEGASFDELMLFDSGTAGRLLGQVIALLAPSLGSDGVMDLVDRLLELDKLKS